MKSMRPLLALLLIAVLLLTGCTPATAPTAKPAEPTKAATSGETVTLTIESWRNDDLTIWQDKIIPAFNAKYPNIKVVFAPSAPTEYNAALNAKL